MPVILAPWEVEVGELWSKAGLNKIVRPYLENKLKKGEA
jgi:hypothetical protein